MLNDAERVTGKKASRKRQPGILRYISSASSVPEEKIEYVGGPTSVPSKDVAENLKKRARPGGRIQPCSSPPMLLQMEESWGSGPSVAPPDTGYITWQAYRMAPFFVGGSFNRKEWWEGRRRAVEAA